MKVTWRDRLKALAYTTRVNRVMEAPVTKQEHNRQRDLVLARERMSDNLTERRQAYARRTTVRPTVLNTSGGWRHGQQTPPRPTKGTTP